MPLKDENEVPSSAIIDALKQQYSDILESKCNFYEKLIKHFLAGEISADQFLALSTPVLPPPTPPHP